MSNKPKSQMDDNDFERMRRMRDLESPLERVIEQDGIILLTPAGIRRRARRLKNIKKKQQLFRYNKTQCNEVLDDEVEALDVKAIACAVDLQEEPEAVCVSIRTRPHKRSDFVVSLQECFVGPQMNKERSLPEEYYEYAGEYSTGVTSADALTSASLASEVEPWMARKQGMQEGRLDELRAGLRRFGRVFVRPVAVVSAPRQSLAQELQEERKIDAAEVSAGESLTQRINVKNFILAFLGLAFLAVVPAFALTTYKSFAGQSGAIGETGSEAATALAAAAVDEDLNVSLSQLEMASAKFREASLMLDESRLMAVSAAAVAPDKYRGARALLEVGEKTSEAGKILSLGLSKVFDKEKRSLIERVRVLGAHADAALPILQGAERASADVSAEQLPDEHKEQVARLPEQISAAKQTVRELKNLSEAMVGFLGDDELRNYLLVFQNDSELRPSGGFMGSIAEVRMLNGEIHSIYVPEGGPYDLKSQLTARVQSPEPMHLINPLWQFQDANWFADFYKSAEKINWFWSKSGQPTVDGIIAVNASFMEDILEVTGPIEMPEYGKIITADNFYIETQKAVEIEYDKKENKPKKFIGDMFDELLAKVKAMPKDDWLKLAAAASEGLGTKDIQMAMFREEEQEFVEQFGWGGRFKETDGDFLAITEANIAGQKTDRVVKESVLHEVNIKASGSIENKVHLNRVHQGEKNELFYGVRNVSYVRFYLPKGAEVLSAEGFLPPPERLFKEPLEEDGKDPELESIEESAEPGPGTVWTAMEGDYTVVGGWLQLDPGRSQDVIISYRLPFTVRDVLNSMDEDLPEPSKSEQKRAAYLMLYTSQSGKPRQLTRKFNIHPNWEVEWEREDGGGVNEDGEIVWDRDRVSALLLKRK
ncbi:DUF4012 domain-containing protein [Candidatus Uhrbacteria bacterium]|nr:DUF4012 domain-containing protein [Candidatus Uhrbacteria bacterium]